ncbi:MAG: methyltransferase domain-containing protein [Planctomycetes bacterium]|nr:methyltransferase domain-containing protein [Planctomycetota bacterium]MCC7395572.1 methyltransferase domain-containing protein [Planctomycetota bacterium]
MPRPTFLLPLLLVTFAGCHSAPDQPAAPTPVAEASVKPGINDDFLDPTLDVGKYEQRFEGESREVFAQRGRIAGLLDLQPGMAIADVGAGTGLYTMMFAPKVGATGRVYGVDIAPKFVEHIRRTAAAKALPQVQAQLCSERSVELPAASVDLVFVCDTYHHFEYPMATLASMHAALRPGGQLVILDFIREPGTSREWILGHVRAGEAVVRQEVEAAGFTFVRREPTPFLRENYVLRFQKP